MMNDVKLLETCKMCGDNLTLMESVRYPEGTLWAVKRCLNCGGHTAEEVVKLMNEEYQMKNKNLKIRTNDFQKDRLKKIWDIQLDFNEKFYKAKLGKEMDKMSIDEKVHWTKNQLLSIVKESMEVLDEVPSWKEHRNINSDFVISNLYEEIVDVNKFSLGLAQIWGMSFEKFYEEFLRKSYVVEQRWHQEHDLKLIDKTSKIIGIDIDGVLGEYEKCFLNYIYNNYGIEFDTIEDVKGFSGLQKYEEIKSSYRQSGSKSEMEACEGASEFTKILKDNGFTIIILTARPYKKYYTIYPDTLKFLEKQNILFDAIIFDENKHLKIISEFPNLECMIDDNLEIAKSIANLKYKVFLKNPSEKDLNSLNPIEKENIIPFKNLKDILNQII